jgi:hypothetical protein
VPASDEPAMSKCHMLERVSGDDGGGNLWRSARLQMQNSVATVQYRLLHPQPAVPMARPGRPGVCEALLHVDGNNSSEQALCDAVHNSHPLLPLLSFN